MGERGRQMMNKTTDKWVKKRKTKKRHQNDVMSVNVIRGEGQTCTTLHDHKLSEAEMKRQRILFRGVTGRVGDCCGICRMQKMV